MNALGLVLVCWVALAVDQRLGEPAVRYHPVVWMGRYLECSGSWVQLRSNQDPQQRDLQAFWLAAAGWLAGAALVGLLAWALQMAVLQLPWWLAVPALGFLLKPLLAWAMLQSEVRAVEAALGQSLEAGRSRLAFLVSRDVASLNATQVRESAIETLAENLNDSVVAPLFWFALLGLPGAALYRFANTADAMWGYPGLYKGRNWAWAGKWAARVDDALSWMPARITALLLLLAGWLKGLRHLRLAGQLPLEAARTPSPNSGWPMAAMALVLGVGLRKHGVYVLNADGSEAQSAHLEQAVGVSQLALLLYLAVGCAAVLWLRQCVVAWFDIIALFAATGVRA